MAKQKRISSRARAKAQERKMVFEVYHLVYYALGVVESLLAFRFVFKLLGANPNSSFVNFTYAMGGILMSPFRSIFRTATTTGVETVSVFEPATLIAMVVYGLAGWGLAKLIAIIMVDDIPEEA